MRRNITSAQGSFGGWSPKELLRLYFTEYPDSSHNMDSTNFLKETSNIGFLMRTILK